MEIVKSTVEDQHLSPVRQHDGDAGWDLHASQEVDVPAGQMRPVKTGLRMEIPPGYFCDVRSRSGLAAKHSLCVLNSPGTIDSGYRGEIVVLLFNAHADASYRVKRGDRVAQLVFQSLPQIVMKRVAELETAKDGRNAAGLGSTGYGAPTKGQLGKIGGVLVRSDPGNQVYDRETLGVAPAASVASSSNS